MSHSHISCFDSTLGYKYNDGGRSKYFDFECSDCAVRSWAIITGKDYIDVYSDFAHLSYIAKKNLEVDGVDIEIQDKISKDYGYVQLKKFLRSYSDGHLTITDVYNMVGDGLYSIYWKEDKFAHQVAIVDGALNDTYDFRTETDGEEGVVPYHLIKVYVKPEQAKLI